MAWQPVSFTPNQPWNQNAEFLVNAPPIDTPATPPGISPGTISDILMNFGVGSGGPGGWQEAVDAGLVDPNQEGPYDPWEALSFLLSPTTTTALAATGRPSFFQSLFNPQGANINRARAAMGGPFSDRANEVARGEIQQGFPGRPEGVGMPAWGVVEEGPMSASAPTSSNALMGSWPNMMTGTAPLDPVTVAALAPPPPSVPPGWNAPMSVPAPATSPAAVANALAAMGVAFGDTPSPDSGAEISAAEAAAQGFPGVDPTGHGGWI